jgi:hypothetical protein
MPARLEESAGMEMASEFAGLEGRAFSAATAAVQASALREVMKTLEQPAWRRLDVDVSMCMDANGGWCGNGDVPGCGVES